MQAAKRAAERTASRLNVPFIDLAEEDAQSLMCKIDENVEASLWIHNIFWQQQQNVQHKQRNRWHPLMIRFALNLKYLSSGAYGAVGDLSSKRTPFQLHKGTQKDSEAERYRKGFYLQKI